MKFCFVVLGVSFLVFSCNGEVKEVSQSELMKDSLNLKPSSTGRSIQVTLQKEPREIVATWLAYITAQDEMETLNDASLQTIVDKASSYAKIMKELKTSIPDRLKGKAVVARLAVLETKTAILEQLTTRQTLDAKEVQRLANEIPQDFENFKLQLNELFLKTPDQFEIELDDQLDSIQKADENAINIPNIQLKKTENQ